MSTNVKIINWQLSPYTRGIVNLLPDDITTAFTEDTDSDMLTAALDIIWRMNPSVYSQDEHIFSKDLNTLAIYPIVTLITIGGKYFGHVYSWSNDNITNVIGLNVITSDKIINYLLDAIEISSKDKYIRIIQPVYDIVNVLIERGYRLVKLTGDSKLIFDSKLIGNTPLMKNLLFRENDYIKPK